MSDTTKAQIAALRGLAADMAATTAMLKEAGLVATEPETKADTGRFDDIRDAARAALEIRRAFPELTDDEVVRGVAGMSCYVATHETFACGAWEQRR
jgi:hypothetical protein